MSNTLRLFAIALALTPAALFAQPSFETVFEEGVQARRAGDFARAIERLERAVALRPDSAEASYQLGLVYGFSGRYGDAERQLLHARLLSPRDGDTRLALARVKAWRGDHAGALSETDALLAEQPDNLEAKAWRGRVRLYQSEPELAADEFRSVLARDPGNVDALVGLGDAHAARGEAGAARASWQRALEIDPGSTEAAERLRRLVGVERRWRLDVAGFYSSFERQSREPWREATTQLSYLYSEDTQLHVRSEMSQRFGKIDTYFQAGVDQKLLPWLSGYAALGGTPDADFREENALLGGGVARVRGNDEVIGATFITIDVKRANYSAGVVETLSPGLQQYFLDGRLWLTGKRILSDAEDRRELRGWLVRADVRPMDWLGLYAGLADAPESAEGRTQAARSRFAGIMYDISETLSLRFDYLREDRRGSYVREQLGLGFGVRF